MKLTNVKANLERDIIDLESVIMEAETLLNRAKVVIGNDIGSCKRKCSVEKPCTVCRDLRKLDKDIDEYLSLEG